MRQLKKGQRATKSENDKRIMHVKKKVSFFFFFRNQLHFEGIFVLYNHPHSKYRCRSVYEFVCMLLSEREKKEERAKERARERLYLCFIRQWFSIDGNSSSSKDVVTTNVIGKSNTLSRAIDRGYHHVLWID